jgi:hypothetical protein
MCQPDDQLAGHRRLAGGLTPGDSHHQLFVIHHESN